MADPDISGIGVRVAVYLQACLSIVQFAFLPLALRDVRARADVRRVRQIFGRGRASVSAMLITSMALLIASIIKAYDNALSPYHSLIFQNLTWTLFLSAASNVLMLGVLGDALTRQGFEIEEYYVYVGQSPLVHLMIMILASCFLGTLIYPYDADGESAAPAWQCPNSTVLWMFGVLVHVADPAFITFFELAYMAGFGAVFLMTPAVIFARPVVRVRQPALVAIPVSMIPFLIASTERTIVANDVAAGETVWGFGQVVTLLLALVSIWQAVCTMWAVWRLRTHPASKPHEFDLGLLPTAAI